MKHLLFLYLSLSYSIGLPAWVLLLLAFFRNRVKMTIYMFFFLSMVTLQLIYLTYVEYRYANTFYWFSGYDALINYTLQSFMVITLPYLFNEWLSVPHRYKVNILFGVVFLISLVLVVGPFFLGLLEEITNYDALLCIKIFRGVFIFIIFYILLISAYGFRNLQDDHDRVFLVSTVGCLILASSQVFIPVFHTFPENVIIFAAAYFFWNLFLLRYIIGKFFLNTFPGNTLKEVINDLKLTEREKEILYLLAQGQSNRKIGTQLFISETTVKTHIQNIYKKLEVNNRVQLFNLLK